MSGYLIGIDVGTSSARGALFTFHGEMVLKKEHPITIWNDTQDFYEQSSENIWSAVCNVIRSLLAEKKDASSSIHGISFGATCSLVALDKDGHSLSISKNGAPEKNVIMWCDHRAAPQTHRINSTNHPLLQFVGGKISIEMEPPKIMWLKENIPNFLSKTGHLMDLCDFLTFRATGSNKRSVCSLTSKWLFQTELGKWNDHFWTQIDLKELTENYYSIIGNSFGNPGDFCGTLTDEACTAMGISIDSPRPCVGLGVVDAYAATLGALNCSIRSDEPITSSNVINEASSTNQNSIVMVAGTSTCHMALVNEATFVPGVWGPFKGAVLPDKWLLESGQSAVGNLLDHVLRVFSDSTPAYTHDDMKIGVDGSGDESIHHQVRDVHVCPDFHGNRSPLADPHLRGMISGLSLTHNNENCRLIYLATLQGLAYGTRRILKSFSDCGLSMSSIVLVGGLQKNSLYVQVHADVTGLPVLLPECPETGLLGAAMLGSVAGCVYSSIHEASLKMSGYCTLVEPDTMFKSYHDKKYQAYCTLINAQYECRKLMESINI